VQTLGVSFAHDSGTCLYKDGKILSFYKEERLSRKKRDRNPYLSLIKTLENMEGEIDSLALCPVLPTDYSTVFSILSKYGHEHQKMKIFDLHQSHHLQHASLAFYNSGFEQANVIVVDRNGSEMFGARESETIFEASYPAKFNPIYKSFWIYENYSQMLLKHWSLENSVEVDAKSLFGIVKVYESATTLIGQGALENGKIMGLSAYGDKTKKFPDFFVNNTNIPNDFYFSHTNGIDGEYQSIYEDFYHLLDKDFSEKNYQDYADLSWQVQKQTQSAVAHLVKKAISKNKIKNIVISGGYGLNVVSNQFLIKSFPDVNFYFEPIADDSGNCIGGAMLAYRSESEDKRIRGINTTFFHGQRYSLKHIVGKKTSLPDIAKMIVDNKSVAIYNGLAEAGPRSLGNRSILFNAMNKNAKKIINVVKKREWYRPFALSVLKQDAEKYFEMIGLDESKFMTISFDALSETKKLFPGVVHVDGSCRIQTVDEEDGILFYILSEIKKISGHGVVLNTSFNLAGQPLVETPENALEVLNNSDLDAVWFAESSSLVFNKKNK
jgi:carbamoyltransferase